MIVVIDRNIDGEVRWLFPKLADLFDTNNSGSALKNVPPGFPASLWSTLL